MTTQYFIQQLSSRYLKLKDDPLAISDMEKGLKTFSYVNREKLFNAFIDNYILNRAPRWADLNKVAFHVGISRSVENPLKDAFNICMVCRTAYSAIGRTCPVCHKRTDFTVSAGDKPSKFHITREDCGQCKLYKGNGTDGILCTDFGTGKSYTMPMCRDDCKCNRCCYETLAIHQGVHDDRNKFDMITKNNKWEDRLLDECKTL